MHIRGVQEAMSKKKKAKAKKTWIDKLTRHEEPCGHIRWDDIEKHAPPDELKSLSKWMNGQTMLGCDDGTGGVYTWDFDRWVRQGKHTEQGMNWD